MDPVVASASVQWLEGHPELAAVVLILVGAGLARVARYLTLRGLAVANRGMARFGSGRADLVSERVIRLLGTGAFWLVLAFAGLLALRTLGTGRVFTWIDVPLAYLPRLFVGLLIIGIGHLL